jgi:hypothetical protein
MKRKPESPTKDLTQLPLRQTIILRNALKSLAKLMAVQTKRIALDDLAELAQSVAPSVSGRY